MSHNNPHHNYNHQFPHISSSSNLVLPGLRPLRPRGFASRPRGSDAHQRTTAPGAPASSDASHASSSLYSLPLPPSHVADSLFTSVPSSSSSLLPSSSSLLPSLSSSSSSSGLPSGASGSPSSPSSASPTPLSSPPQQPPPPPPPPARVPLYQPSFPHQPANTPVLASSTPPGFPSSSSGRGSSDMSDGTVRDSSGSTGRLSTESASSGSPPAVLASVEVFNSCAEDLTPQHELPKRVLSRHVYVDSTWTMSRVLSLVLESETYLFAQVQGETVTESGEAATAAAAAYSSSSSASLSLDSASTGRTRLCDTTGWQTFLATMSPRSHSSGSSATSSSRTSQSPRSQVAVRLRFFVCEDVKACTCLGCRFLYVKQSSRRVCNACNRGGRELPPGSVLRVHKDNEEEVSDLLGDEEHWKFVGPKPPTRRRTKKRSGRSAAGSPSDDDSNPCKETDVAYYAVFESQEVAKTVRREAQEQDVELDWIDMTLLRCMLRMVSHFWRLEVHYRFDDAQHALDLMRASESEDSDAAAAAAAAAAASRQSPISPVSSSSEEHPNTLTTETGAVYLLLDGDQRVRLVPAGSYPKSGKSSRKTASKNKRKADAVVTLPSPMDAAINRNPGLLLTPSTVHTPPMRGEQDLSTLSQLPPAEQAVPERARKALRLTEEPLERSFDASPAPSPAPSSMPTTYPTGASLLSIGPNSHTSELSLTERVVMLRSQDQQLEAQWTMMKRHQQQQQHIHRMVVDHIQAGGGHEMAAQDGTTPMQLLKRERDISDHIRRRLAEVEARRLQVRQELHNCRISLQDHHRKQALEQQVREQQLRAERQRIEARQQQLLLQQKRVHQLEHQVQQQPPPQQQQQQQQQLHQPQHQYQQPRTQLEQHMHLQRLREQQQQLHYQHQQLMQQQQQQRQHWNHAPSMQQHYAQLEQQSMFAPSGGHYDDPQSAFPFAPPPVEPIDMLPMDFEDPFSYTIGSGDIAIPDDSVVSQFLDPDDDVQMETVFKLQGGADEVDDGYVTADVGEEAREGEYVTADVVERVDALQGKHAATGSSIRSMQARLYASLRSMGTVKERARAADRLRRRAGATGDVDDERKSGDTDDDEEEEEDNEDQRPLWAAPAPEEPARRAPESRLRLWQNKLFALQFHELSILFMCMLALLGFSIVVHAMVVNDHPSHNDYAGFNLLRRSFDPARESRALYRSQQRGATLLHGLRQLSPAFNAWAVAEIKASRAQTLLNSPGVLDPLSLQPDVLNAVCGEMVMHNEHVDAALASLQSDPLAVSSAPVPPPPNNAPECTSLESTTLGAAWLSHLCRGDDNLRVRLSNADPDCVLCSIGPSQSCSTASSPAVCSAVRQHVLNVWVPSISTVAEAAVDEDTAALVATLHVQSARGRWANAGGAASSICFEAASLIADAQSNAEDRSQSFMVSGWMLLLVMLTSAALPTLLYVALSVFECRCPRWLRPAKKWRKPRRESRASRVALVPPPPSASGSSSRSRSRNTVVPAPAEVAM